MGKFSKAIEKTNMGKAVKGIGILTDTEKLIDEESAEVESEMDFLISEQTAKSTIESGISSDKFTKEEYIAKPAPKNNYPLYAQKSLSKSLVVYHRPQSYESEQFRILRTNILFPPQGRTAPRTILITSALPNEGKSFVTSNLAFTISQNIDKHVLLIDCDIRQPKIHSIFGYKNVPGLSNYLQGQAGISDLLLKTASKRLSILAGGPIAKNPAELLSSNRMLALLQEVRSRYSDRYIIMDSPPPTLTAESRALAEFVNGIIVVVKFGETNRELVSDLVEKLPKDKIIGIVANWMDKGSNNLYGSGKYAKYGYYMANKQV